MDVINLTDQEVEVSVRAATLINMMKQAGVGSILWYIDGHGDSPNESALHYYEDPNAARLCGDTHGYEISPLAGKLKAVGIVSVELDSFCEEVLNEKFDNGWYNNEGGYAYVWVCAGDRPQVGAVLWEYPEPEAEKTGAEVVFGAPYDPSIDP